MTIQFPDSPSQGDTFEASNQVTYTYDSGGWTANNTVGLNDLYVEVAGDTMTGDLTVPNLISEGDVQTTSLNGGSLGGFRNLIINGAVTINQRGRSYEQVSNDNYWADRWKKVSGGMTQIIDRNNFEPNSIYTLSGNGITTQQLTSPGEGEYWTIPTIPSTATNIQLELGPVATPFERRPFVTELNMCQRYHQNINVKLLFDQMNNGVSFYSSFVNPMRSPPSAGFSGKLKWEDLVNGRLSSDPYFSTGVNASSKVVFTSRFHLYIKLVGERPGNNVKYAFEEAMGLDAEI